MNTIFARIDAGLAHAEQTLPPALSAPIRLQRTIAARLSNAAGNAMASAWRSARNVKNAQARAYNTVAGTTRWAAATTARAGRTVKGQATAQTRQFGQAARSEFEDLAESASGAAESLRDTAVDAVQAAEVAIAAETGPTNETYEDLTKEELYRRAKALDVEGRSQMSKDELIEAVRAAA